MKLDGNGHFEPFSSHLEARNSRFEADRLEIREGKAGLKLVAAHKVAIVLPRLVAGEGPGALTCPQALGASKPPFRASKTY